MNGVDIGVSQDLRKFAPHRVKLLDRELTRSPLDGFQGVFN